MVMRMTYRFIPAAAVLLTAAFTFQAGASSASVRTSRASSRVAQPAALSCDQTDFQSAAPADTTIVSVRTVSAPVSYCDVDGFVSTTERGPDSTVAVFRSVISLPLSVK
jgi:long-subunit fatty acid transport protein